MTTQEAQDVLIECAQCEIPILPLYPTPYITKICELPIQLLYDTPRLEVGEELGEGVFGLRSISSDLIALQYSDDLLSERRQ